ncbi:hypothetical protein GCM10011349_26930 [Novosphingobium indicum]|jgi:hypothetical protein|uniref:Uncharacterized protein n=1 Tax=Novosphingobium indicum TaxID=462949 RepID=A0ABQ2JP71_9SPHN|nr:hypothetical protein [Novosphingobium indicum]GGN52905.1 hypothetical protein GCM10011349_26930 [Novosphingobium indicum]|tara:strand:- start:467 stop:622 length:156 start_codon:yes stop_codon:yes gene_type:complete
MHLLTKGTSKRPKNIIQTYPHTAGTMAPALQRPAGLLTREHLRRIVAAMVD